ncbi:MAG: S8 family peptidase [Anaerolineales bacterium]
MHRKRSSFNILLALILALSLLAVSTGSALAKKDKPPSINPDFLQLVQAYPDDTFTVIVQKDAKNKDLKDMELEDEVLNGRGQIRKQLDLIMSFSAEMTGREIEKLAKNPKVHWISPDAPMVSTGNAGLSTIMDTFKNYNYSGNNGTERWAGSWVEGNQAGDANVSTPNSGLLRLDFGGQCADFSGYCLRVNPGQTGAYIYREANLDNAASATLSFYRYNRLNENFYSGAVNLDISSDAGATWSTLRSYSNRDYTGNGVDIFNITAYASPNTRIRFYITETQQYSRDIFFDNIKIEYAVGSAYREVVGAEALWQQTGLDGQGVTVAVVDSGISDHIDLHQEANNANQATDSNSRIIDSVVFGGYGSPMDEYAHGTHVAGIIAGNGNASKGEYKGIAPGVNLLNVRVSSEYGLTYLSDVIDSLQWVYENKDVYNIRVANLSLTSTAPESYHTSPLDAAVEILWFNGITVVVAAGNNGTADGPVTIYPPANDPFVITVGAVEDRGTPELDDDFIGTFSAYGTTESGFAKPELIAPGRNLISLLASTDATAYKYHPKHHVDDFYFRMSGTSMSAPVVSGVVALLLQDEPDLTPDQVKYRLMATANQEWSGYDAAKAGAGTVDANAAVYSDTSNGANQGIIPSYMLSTGEGGIAFDSVGWNSVGWNSVGWNSVGWNSVGWNSVGWNSVGWNSVGWNTSTWDEEE